MLKKLNKNKLLIYKIIVGLILIQISTFSIAQKKDSTVTHVNGTITVTNNGLSFIPTFSLGKPAAIFDFSIKKNKLKFEPQLRFSLADGKPWSFIFWVRYNLIKSDKLNFNIGAHPSFVFAKTTIINSAGISKDLLTVNRYLATELFPIYKITKNINLGLYYLYSRGITEDITKNTHFVALSTSFLNIKIYNDFKAKIIPQIYYLKMDANDGVYTTASLTLSKNKCPFTLSSIVNKKIHSSIVSKDFVWNLNLIYSF